LLLWRFDFLGAAKANLALRLFRPLGGPPKVPNRRDDRWCPSHGRNRAPAKFRWRPASDTRERATEGPGQGPSLSASSHLRPAPNGSLPVELPPPPSPSPHHPSFADRAAPQGPHGPKIGPRWFSILELRCSTCTANDASNPTDALDKRAGDQKMGALCLLAFFPCRLFVPRPQSRPGSWPGSRGVGYPQSDKGLESIFDLGGGWELVVSCRVSRESVGCTDIGWFVVYESAHDNPTRPTLATIRWWFGFPL